MPLLKDHIRQAAVLARLRLTPAETEKLTLELPSVFGYFDRIKDIPVISVPPYRGSPGSSNSLREDEVRPSLPVDRALDIAPAADRGFIIVPKVVDR